MRAMKFVSHIVAVVLMGIAVNWLPGSPVTEVSDVVLHHLPGVVPTAYADATKPRVVDWQMLSELDYQTGQKSPTIDQLVGDGVTVRVPGFIIPFEDAADTVTEFLLTPYLLTCIHVPPPPPNQMIYVKMAGSTKHKVSWEPVWVEGRLQVVETASPYGEASYTMTGLLIERY